MDQFDNGHLPIDMIHLPSAGPHVVPQAPIEAKGGLDDDGLVNRNTDAIADAGNDAAKSKSDIEMQARTLSDKTRLSPRSTAATGWPDSSKHTTTTVEDGPQALSQMNCCEDVGPDMNNNTSWPMGSQGMIGMPPAMPAC
ncbi:hypothetical protein BKA60DRAFT_602867 [Fusarium oxysporum]|nr:hypothetical protein BKA60DRAFT_602867 [Fusarium oxysporum]